MKLKISLLSFLFLTLAGFLQAQSRETLFKYVAESSDWKPAGNLKQYDDSSIGSFAGKAAATLKRYGLIGVSVEDWSGPRGRVQSTVYEMTDASAGYGFFTFERSPGQQGFETVPLGTEGFRVGNRSYFWQGKYVVRLVGDSAASDSLARIISKNIFGRSRKPVVSEHLPLNNLIPESEKYIVDPAGLDPALGLNATNLGFDDDVEIATGRYQLDGRAATLVLLIYPTQQIAKKHMDAWDASSADDKAFRKRVGPLVGMVRETKDATVAKQILDSVGYESSVTWNQQKPDLSIRTVILTVFTFIGIALLFTLVAGISFGGLRIFVKARYPDRMFDRPEQMEIIQLHLDQ